MSTRGTPAMRFKSLVPALGALVLLSGTLAGCVSIGRGGEDPADQLFTLTATTTAPAGATAQGNLATALSVTEPDVPQYLDELRVPVQINANAIAYLQDAFWIEKPASLFQRVLTDTIRAGSTRLVVGGGELEYAAQTQLGGELTAMGYDATRGSVIVRYDAVLHLPDGSLRTRRFESEISGIAPDALAVGPALNRAANDVAAQVAQWVG